MVKYQANGICTTCIHASTCSHIRKAGQHVHYCEEFDCSSPGCHGSVNRYEPPVIAMKQASRPEPLGLKGLCINCDRRHDCSLCKNAGGVWHCEEYC